MFFDSSILTIKNKPSIFYWTLNGFSKKDFEWKYIKNKMGSCWRRENDWVINHKTFSPL